MRGPVRFGAYVYMLECADGSYYVGLTRRQYLETRISEHEQGLVPGYTSARRPVKLVWVEHIPRLIDAIAAERRIKGWSRAKKQALIRSDWAALQTLAKRRGGAPR
jgi:putative endonuclease